MTEVTFRGGGGAGGEIETKEGVFCPYASFVGIDAYALVPSSPLPLSTLLDVRLPFPLCERLYPDPVLWVSTSPHRKIESFWETRLVRSKRSGSAAAAAIGLDAKRAAEGDGQNEEEDDEISSDEEMAEEEEEEEAGDGGDAAYDSDVGAGGKCPSDMDDDD